MIGTHIMLVPTGADLKEEDRVTTVKDRRGRVLVSEPQRIVGLIPLETHMEAALESYT